MVVENNFIVTPLGQAISPMLFKQFVKSQEIYKKIWPEYLNIID